MIPAVDSMVLYSLVAEYEIDKPSAAVAEPQVVVVELLTMNS